MKMTSRRGFTISEVLTTCALYSIILIVLGIAVTSGEKLFRRVSAKYDTESQLQRALPRLQEEIRATSLSTVEVNSNPPAIWFLTNYGPPSAGAPEAPDTFIPQMQMDGSPRWQRHIVYYLCQPNQHDQIANQSCGGYTGDDDTICPHKVLIRAEITFENPDPTDAAQVEQPHSLATWLAPVSRSSGYNVSGLRGTTINAAQVKRIDVLGRNLLSFRANKVGNRVQIELKAVALGQAQREIKVGQVDLATSRFTTQYQFLVTPQDN